MAKIFLIGAGPGSVEYVTPAARETVGKASLVIGAKRALELFQADIKSDAHILKAESFDETVERALSLAREGTTIALVSTGDPTFFGLLKPLLERCPTDLELEILPGISSIQVATARLQICLEEIGLFLSFHGRPHKEKAKLTETIRSGQLAVIIPDPTSFQPDQIAKYLIDSGIDPATPAAVCENLTYGNERIMEGDLLTVSSEKYEPMCLMVVGTRMRKILHDALK